MNKILRNIILLSITLVYGCFDTIGGGSSSSVLISNEELLVKSSPSQITADDTNSAFLFDGDNESAYAPLETKQVVVKFPVTQKVSRFKISGKSSYSVNVYKGSGDSKEEIKEFKYTGSSSLDSWNSFNSSSGVLTDTLTIEITPLDSSNTGIKEIEIWRSEKSVIGNDKANGNLFNIKTASDIESYSSKNLEHVRCFTSSGDISFSNKTVDDPASITVNININPLLFKRAYLSYSGKNVKTPASIKTRINGGTWFGGGAEALIDSSEYIPHSIEINPASLKSGINTIEFARTGDVNIKNFKIYAEFENGYNLISSVSDSAAYDRSAGTNASLNLDTPTLIANFERKIEPDYLHIYFASVPTSPFIIQYVKDNIWVDSADAIKAASMKTGWNKIKIVDGLSTDALRIKFTEENPFKAEIAEIYVSGSPSANIENPNIITSFPRNGEYFTRTASIFGFVKSSKTTLGTDKLNIADKAIKSLSPDGRFSFSLTKEEAGFSSQADDDAWKANLIFNNGSEYSSTVAALTKNINSTKSGNTTGSSSTGSSSGSSTTTDSDTVSTDTEYRTIIDPKSKKSITYQDVTLDIPAGAVDKATEIKIIPLKASDLQKLDPGMTNVTTPFAGYRFLPHGSFKKSLTLKLGYEKSKIPAGHKEKDISSFYFDENERRWKKLETVQIDASRMMVLSATNHFTDIINATLTTPEHPDPLSYNPNSIKDIKAGDPSSGVNLIEAPKASNTGDAGLSYPIEIPKGRNGMQPDVTIKYNSGGGNSWLGLGWDIHVSSIAVDTTFGVPRYDGTETYTLDGSKLVYDSATSTYRPRVEGSFAKIIKNGNQWEVTDKNGTKSIYGETVNGRLGNGQWNIEKVIDTSGNSIVYKYENTGEWLYLSEISYTGTNGSDGPYKIIFTRDQTARTTDVTVSARMGFKTALRFKLNSIQVTYNGNPIRRYDLQYKTGRYGKLLLEKINQVGAGGTQFNEHTFEYYDDIEANGNNGFKLLDNPVISGSLPTSDGWNLNVNGLIGITLFNLGNNTAVGIKIGGGGGETFTRGLFIDIDGDGLPDYVFSTIAGVDRKMYFCKNTSTPEGGISFANRELLNFPFTHLGHEESSNFNVGFMGTAFYFGGGMDFAFNWGTGLGYIADSNGDGLPDYVYKGNVYYNTLNNGKPSFSMDCPTPGITTSSVADFAQSMPADSIPDAFKQNNLLKKFYRDDPLLVWKAPFRGVVSIKGDLKLLNKLDSTITTDDGVRVSIEKGGNVIWQDEIRTNRYNEAVTPLGTDSIFVDKGDRIFFRVDSIYDGNADMVQWSPIIEYAGPGTNITDENNFYSYKFDAKEDFNITGNDAELIIPTTGKVDISGTFYKGLKTSDDVALKIFLIREEQKTVNNKPVITEISRQEIYSKEISRDTVGATSTISVTGISVFNNFARENQPAYFRDKILCKINSDTPVNLKDLKAALSLEYTEAEIESSNLIDFNNGVNPQYERVVTLESGDKVKGLKAPLPITYSVYPETDDHAPYSWKSSSPDRIGNASVVMSLNLLTNGSDPFINILNEYTGSTGTNPFVMPDGYSADITLAVKVMRAGVVVDVKKKKYIIKNETIQTDLIDFTPDITLQEGDEVFFIAASDQFDIQNFIQVIDPKITIGANNFYDARTYLYRAKDKSDPFSGGFKNWYFARYNGENEGPLDLAKMKVATLTEEQIPKRSSYPNTPAGDEAYQNAIDEANSGVRNFTGMISNLKPEPTRSIYPETPEGETQYQTALEEAKRKVWEGHDKSCFIGMKKYPDETSGQDLFIISSTRVGQKYIKDDDEALVLPVVKAATGSNPGAGAGRGVIKNTYSFTIGGALMTIVVDASTSRTTSTSYVDYVDLNGDGYADIIKSGVVNYTKPDGSYEGARATNFGPYVSSNYSDNYGFSGPGSAESLSIPQSNSVSAGAKSIGGGKRGTAKTSPSISGSFSFSDNHNTSCALIDINGDGLPDKVYEGAGGVYVQYNYGYGLQGPEILVDKNGTAFRSSGSASVSLAAGVGVSIDKMSYGGGVSASLSQSASNIEYIDINGDGLPDRVIKSTAFIPFVGYTPINNSGAWVVYLNTGDGFSTTPILWTGTDLSQAINDNLTVNIGANVFFSIRIPIFAIGLLINPSISGGATIGWNKTQMVDIDGDGFPDHVITKTNTSNPSAEAAVYVSLNTTGKTNLLQSVNRPLGGKISIEYKRAGNTQDMPKSKWTMSKSTIKDGNNNSYVTDYAYENGKWDRYEKESYGFGKVTETRADGTKLERYFNKDPDVSGSTETYYTKGLEYKSELKDSSNKTYVTTKSVYDLKSIVSSPGNARKESMFPFLMNKTTTYTEGSYVSSTQSYEYDSYGNVKKFTESGSNITGVTADIEYEYNTGAYIVSKPKVIRVKDANGKQYRHRMGSYDGKGRLVQLIQTNSNSDTAVTDLQYDAYGNLMRITGPSNNAGQRYSETYTYDITGNIIEIKDSFGYSSRAKYDERWGKPLYTIDINSQYMTYSYDEYGRTTAIYSPNDLGSGRPTIEYRYDIQNRTCTTTNKPMPESNQTIDTVTEIDGLKRVTRTKMTSEVNGSAGMTVSGNIVYDNMGRVIQQGEPTFNTPGMQNPTTFTYDVLGRKKTITFPDGTSIQNNYTIDGTNLTTTTTDQNNRTKVTVKNIRGEILRVTEPLSTTSYAYNPMGEITQVKDDAGNNTDITYDNFGRRIGINNPDTGLVEYGYDTAGNMTRKITPNQREKGTYTKYRYTFNRLDRIDYTDMPSVIYTYGNAGAGNNRAGRIATVENGDYKEERSYGKLGEITRSLRQIKVTSPAAAWKSYETKYTWDNMGRMQTITYPDGEVLRYTYNRGGLLKAATGSSSSTTETYLKEILYDQFGQRTKASYGNGTETTYTYDVMRRLQFLKTKKDAKQYQNIEYTYDNIGNIKSRTNTDFLTAEGTPKTSTQTYSYDQMERLTYSEGKYGKESWIPFKTTRENVYTNELNYSSIGNITRKVQVNNATYADTGKTVSLPDTTYTLDYVYDPIKVHAVINDGTRTYSYDPNGNMITRTDIATKQTRTMAWDEENRLTKVTDAGITEFKYDDTGTRIIKKGNSGEVVYVNQNYTVRDGSLASKHIFAGNTRLASKVNATDASGTYYYHADHLGSSSVVTAKDGSYHESLEYFPYGETWVHEKGTATNFSTPYQFTSKELDPETGLYYHGARYRDARLNNWLSPDPKRTTLSLYTYAKNNPLRYSDPDGNVDVDDIASGDKSFGQAWVDEARRKDSSGEGLEGGGKTAVNELKNAQDAARNNPTLFKGAGGPGNNPGPDKTWCNQGAYDVLEKMGVDTRPFTEPAGRMYTDANQMVDNMNASTKKGKLLETTPENAQELANKGFAVVAGQKKVGGIGHVSTVRPSSDGYDPINGPIISNVGDKNFIGTVPETFGVRPEDIQYFFDPNQSFE